MTPHNSTGYIKWRKPDSRGWIFGVGPKQWHYTIIPGAACGKPGHFTLSAGHNLSSYGWQHTFDSIEEARSAAESDAWTHTPDADPIALLVALI